MMKEITVKSNDTRNFAFFISGNGIGTLVYKNWFSLTAEIKLADHQSFVIEPKGVWGTTVEVKKDEKTLLSFKMSWGGNIIFKTFLGGKENEFIFRKKGMLKNVYTLADKDGNQLIEVQPDFKWGKMSFDYVIVAND
ncbi:MAG: hypothetical protein IAF38_21585, partial [Bacteroidia bacterium]|nr:hypothetical protein [Bacteroidia bacterium]